MVRRRRARELHRRASCDIRERRVLDLGAGGGIVAITAAKNGAASVLASERDAHGRAALALNAEANGVAIEVTGDLTDELAPTVDLVLAGDTFYDRNVAARVLPFLDRCLAAGIEVLIGDPNRADLPPERLTQLATMTCRRSALRATRR